MKIVPVAHDLELGVSSLPRTLGLHMSDIYGRLYEELEPKRFRRDTPMPLEKLEAGLTFETILEEGLARRLAGDQRPGEFITKEGIIYSPDLLLFNGETRLGEIKLTWMSSREMPQAAASRLPPKFDKWVTQMSSYCHNLETPYARLYSFFVNGNYEHPYEPELRAWDVEFSARDLKDNWRMMLNFAKQRRML